MRARKLANVVPLAVVASADFRPAPPSARGPGYWAARRELARDRLMSAVAEYDTTKPDPRRHPDQYFIWCGQMLGTLSEAARAMLEATEDK